MKEIADTLYHNESTSNQTFQQISRSLIAPAFCLLQYTNSIFWLGYSKQKNPTISIFITDQIKDYYTIIVSDNGPGFNIGTDVAVKPFISGKPDNIGMGIGLHIANEMMNAMGGKLLFYEKEDLEFNPEIIQSGATKAIVALCFKK